MLTSTGAVTDQRPTFRPVPPHEGSHECVLCRIVASLLSACIPRWVRLQYTFDLCTNACRRFGAALTMYQVPAVMVQCIGLLTVLDVFTITDCGIWSVGRASQVNAKQARSWNGFCGVWQAGKLQLQRARAVVIQIRLI
jgi:hypothetical protein